MNAELAEMFQDVRFRHSMLQMDAFIVANNGKTLGGCYFQALRELFGRETTIEDEETEIDLAEIEIKRLAKRKDPKSKIELVRKKRELERRKMGLVETRREHERFYLHAVRCREALREQGYTFPLSEEDRDKLDREMWAHKLKMTCAIEIMSGGLRPSTIELLTNLPNELRQMLPVLLDPEQRDRLIEWFCTYEPKLPTLEIESCSDSQTLQRPSLNTSRQAVHICHASS